MKYNKITYGQDKDQFYKLYLQTETPNKLIILVHGGYWRNAVNLTSLQELETYFVEKGYSLASIEYRRGSENQWPIPREDVAAAIKDIKNRYSNAELITIGHSVGGQLALFTSNLVDKTIALAPVTDVNFTYQHKLGDNAVEEYYTAPITEQLLAEASPINYELNGVKKVLVIQGKDDNRVLVETSDNYIKKQNNSEIPIDYLRLSSMPHTEIILPSKPFWNYVITWIE
ncbi:alpha/beta hydrolase [Otariodibacter sp.]|uniref:alpha/beta hydrolase n=1 Tax=Otariodibacter sp. TaxID=3030919 RepID=UPI00262E89D6|nr:alpha/beta hydrolase [Otariodibacter sp.]